MYRLKKEHGRIFDYENDIETVITEKANASKTINCNRESCQNITFIRYRIMDPGDYFIYMEFNYTKDTISMLDSIKFSGRTMSGEFAALQGAVKAILFVASLVNCAWFWINLKKMEPSKYIFEQRYMKWLNVAMCFFFDPFTILQHFYPSAFG